MSVTYESLLRPYTRQGIKNVLEAWDIERHRFLQSAEQGRNISTSDAIDTWTLQYAEGFARMFEREEFRIRLSTWQHYARGGVIDRAFTRTVLGEWSEQYVPRRSSAA
jgi:hypothetical protein